jgi:hypothetical protein
MDGFASGAATHHDRRGRFANGNTEYRAKQQRVAEKARQLSLDYDPSPSQHMLLPIIARHLDDAERARSAERRVRAGNAATRLLRQLQRREAPLRTLQELEQLYRQKEAAHE